MSNYKLSDKWTQPGRDPAGTDRSCITGGHISFSVPQMISCAGVLVPLGRINACSGIQAPDIQTRAESCGWFDTACWPRRSLLLNFFFFFLQVVTEQQVCRRGCRPARIWPTVATKRNGLVDNLHIFLLTKVRPHQNNRLWKNSLLFFLRNSWYHSQENKQPAKIQILNFSLVQLGNGRLLRDTVQLLKIEEYYEALIYPKHFLHLTTEQKF